MGFRVADSCYFIPCSITDVALQKKIELSLNQGSARFEESCPKTELLHSQKPMNRSISGRGKTKQSGVCLLGIKSEEIPAVR
jgi:hypothetical protein